MKTKTSLLFILITAFFLQTACNQSDEPELSYLISMPQPETHAFHVEFEIKNLDQEALLLKMPKWMPGYYQLMDYADDVQNMTARNAKGASIPIEKMSSNTWRVDKAANQSLVVSYDVHCNKQFVARSFLDSTHAYIVPANNFVYVDGMLEYPVSVKVMKGDFWSDIATGLQTDTEEDLYTAPDYDILYDCPILIGNLEELPPFQVRGITHRFIGYNIGTFDKEYFISSLEKVVEAAVAIFDDIPYKDYTFIAIGPGRGGIEHLNSTTISFDGNNLKTESDIHRTLNFIGHEYFHHYNVKRIRPVELGPFDYDRENRTTQLWVSEGLTVYYEYIIVKRAGLVDEKVFMSNFEKDINAVESNPGRKFQSLSQSSYNTWSDGPFGKRGETISYYEKGPVVGLIMDLAIRNASENSKSLDDVMRFVYQKYYKELKRGFTDAEFQQACEEVAGISLSNEFEYITTTKEIDYNKYLAYAGLQLNRIKEDQKGEQKLKIERMVDLNPLQIEILKSWLNE